jgi:hypothetical protein
MQEGYSSYSEGRGATRRRDERRHGQLAHGIFQLKGAGDACLASEFN